MFEQVFSKPATRAVAALLAVLATLSAASAQTIYVNNACGDDAWSGASAVCGAPDGPKGTIQAGINAAANGDTVLVADGTYTGPGNRDLDFAGRAITVRSASGDPNLCIIDTQASELDPHRALHFHSGETAASAVEGFTIRNGFMDRGAAVLCEGGSAPEFRECVFQQNTALTATSDDGGGAVYNLGSNPTFNDCDFLENHAEVIGGIAGGGALRIQSGGGATLNRCRFIDNSAGQVGAINVVDSSIIANDCDFLGNTASAAYGGAGVVGAVVVGADSSGTFTRCRFLSNTATGGAVGAVFVSGGVSTADFTDCQFVGNSAAIGSGGAVAVQNQDPRATFTNCLFASNLAAFGGALWIDDGTATVTNCTFSGNTATNQAGALRVKDLATVSVDNAIVWDNSPDQITVEIGGDLSISYSDVQGGWAGVGNIDTDPLFVAPDGPDDDPNTFEDNDYRLSAGSPCIDAGDNGAVPADALDLDGNGDTTEPIPVDADWRLRFADRQGTTDTGATDPNDPGLPIVDMGAYEYQCAGDLTGDGAINISDLGQLLSNFGTMSGANYADGDINQDGAVNISDLGALLAMFGTVCD